MAVLDQLRAIEQHVERRLRELAPLVAEYRDLQKVAERLGLKSDTPEPTDAPAAAAPRRTARPTSKTTTSRGSASTTARGSAARASARKQTAPASSRTAATKRTPAAAATDGSAKGTATRRRRRVAAPGSREQDVLRLVRERPGISIAEIAKHLGVDATGLYRAVRRLQAEGQIRKDGTALRPIDAATPTPPSPTAAPSKPTGTQPPTTPQSPAPPPPEPTATKS